MSAFIVALNAVVPIFLMMILGFGAKKLGFIGEEFVSQATKFVFRISLPAMIFYKIATLDLRYGLESEQVKLMIFCGAAIVVACGIAKVVATYGIKEKVNDRGYVDGAFVQGAFRTNYIIIGYPVLMNLFGDAVVINMALVTLVAIPAFNILSVIALTQSNQHNSYKKYVEILLNIAKNPLIIAIVLGFGTAYFGIEFPQFLSKFIGMTGNLATPLALVAIGAFFHFDDLKETLRTAVLAVTLKLFVFPIIFSTLAFVLGFSPMNIILCVILFGGPTAVSSFAMSSEMGGDRVLSGNIVILSSGLCVVSLMIILSTWLTILGTV